MNITKAYVKVKFEGCDKEKRYPHNQCSRDDASNAEAAAGAAKRAADAALTSSSTVKKSQTNLKGMLKATAQLQKQAKDAAIAAEAAEAAKIKAEEDAEATKRKAEEDAEAILHL